MLTYDTETETATVRFTGELDIASYDMVLEQICAIARVRGVSTIALELSGVSFIDCAALGGIIAARRECMSSGVLLAIRDPSWAVKHLLRLTATQELLLHSGLHGAAAAPLRSRHRSRGRYPQA